MMNRKTVFFSLIATVFLFLVACGSSSNRNPGEDDSADPTPALISTNSVETSRVAVDDQWIVWTARESEEADSRVFARPVAGDAAPFAVSGEHDFIRDLLVDGGLVVWQVGNDIYFCDLNSDNKAIAQLPSDGRSKSGLSMHAPILSWTGSSGGVYGIYYAELDADTVLMESVATRDSNSGDDTDTHDGIITWTCGTWPNFNICHYDTQATPPQVANVTDDLTWEANPRINQGIIAWHRTNTGNITDIWFTDLYAAAPGIVQVTDSSEYDDRVSEVSDGVVVWTSRLQTPPFSEDIFYSNVNLGGTDVFRVTDDGESKSHIGIAGEKIVWRAAGNIFLYDIGSPEKGILQLSNDGAANEAPRISATAAVWISDYNTFAIRF